MWIHAFVYLMPLFAAPLPSLQDSIPRYIFGKAEAVDVDLLKVDGFVVDLWGAKAVAYKRKPEELDPISHLQMMLDRQPVRCENLERPSDFGKQRFLGTCYLVGKRTEVNLNRRVVANGFAKSFGTDEYREDEELAQELEVGMWKNRSGLRLTRRRTHRFPPVFDSDRRRSYGGDC